MCIWGYLTVPDQSLRLRLCSLITFLSFVLFTEVTCINSTLRSVILPSVKLSVKHEKAPAGDWAQVWLHPSLLCRHQWFGKHLLQKCCPRIWGLKIVTVNSCMLSWTLCGAISEKNMGTYPPNLISRLYPLAALTSISPISASSGSLTHCPETQGPSYFFSSLSVTRESLKITNHILSLAAKRPLASDCTWSKVQTNQQHLPAAPLPLLL